MPQQDGADPRGSLNLVVPKPPKDLKNTSSRALKIQIHMEEGQYLHFVKTFPGEPDCCVQSGLTVKLGVKHGSSEFKLRLKSAVATLKPSRKLSGESGFISLMIHAPRA